MIVSASLYNELDKLKDKNGRYLLQDSITAAKWQGIGKEVAALDDLLLSDLRQAIWLVSWEILKRS